MKTIVGFLLIVHGFITAVQSTGSFKPSGGVPNPTWLSWFPANLGQSWLLSRLGLEKSFIGSLMGVLWLAAGLALVAAGLGLLGFLVPTGMWRMLAGAGALVSLLCFVVYAHPFFAIGILADLAVLFLLLGARWPSLP